MTESAKIDYEKKLKLVLQFEKVDKGFDDLIAILERLRTTSAPEFDFEPNHLFV